MPGVFGIGTDAGALPTQVTVGREPMSISTAVGDNDAARKCIEEIRHDINVKQMLEIPFFKHIKQQRLSSAELRKFFCQYYSIVKTSYRMLAAGILNATPEDTDAIRHLVRFLETESGGNPSHLALYLRWAEYFGVSKADLAEATPSRLSRAFENTLMGYFSSNDGFIHKAAQLGLEDSAQVLITGLHEGFKQYNVTARGYGYLMIHLLLENDEDGHSRWAIDALCEAPDLFDRLDELRTVYTRVYEAFEGVFNGIYDTWMSDARDGELTGRAGVSQTLRAGSNEDRTELALTSS
jgi:pyrroloquinoline quinone (PQQ) biosynthesis protein C